MRDVRESDEGEEKVRDGVVNDNKQKDQERRGRKNERSREEKIKKNEVTEGSEERTGTKREK